MSSRNQSGDIVMVMGGAGFLGQHIVRLLQEKHSEFTSKILEIRVFDVRTYKNNIGHPEPIPVTSFVGDIRNPDTMLHAFKGVTIVFHTASLVDIRVFPDSKKLEEINVEGTKNVISACIDNNVPILVYTSTVDVMIGPYNIINGNESTRITDKPLWKEYSKTKLKAESEVNMAHGRKLKNGKDVLSTVSIRATPMYGEEDRTLVYCALSLAKVQGGFLARFGKKEALNQHCYVGNVAWGHICAAEKLKKDRGVGGDVFIVGDDTKPSNVFDFLQPFVRASGMRMSSFTLPFWPFYILIMILTWLLWLLLPLKSVININPVTTIDSVLYTNLSIYFGYEKARIKLNYKPIFQPQEAQMRTVRYFKQLFKIEQYSSQ